MRSMKSDPAPSRWAWRLERLMLTPGVRLGLRVGIPFAVMLSAGGWYFSREEVQTRIIESYNSVRASIEQRPEFMVNLMAIEGADPALDRQIRETLPADLPASSFDLDLETMRAQLLEMDPIKAVTLRIRPGGILQIDVTPRVPVMIWRTARGLILLDDTGATVAVIASRQDRPDLPVVAGDGADRFVFEALTLIETAAPLGERLRGLVRVGERRWDVVLDQDMRILLPSENAQIALERVIALHAARDVLQRDVARVDLRLPHRPTIQMQARATEERWRIRDLNLNPE